jgi:MFS transporter, PAT family, beta-lactamase induction signal transducer AmpG
MPNPTIASPLTSPSRLATLQRLLVVTLLGFASGLPLALTGQAMQAWLSSEGLAVATIGFLSLVGLPYTFKFLWAPLLDRFELPLLGRRRGWLVLTQVLLAAGLWAMAATSPTTATRSFALLAVWVALVSASQDVVIDAYRTDLLQAPERGMGASMSVLGYRLAMILSGGIVMIWVDPAQGGGWTWPQVYRFMAGLMLVGALLSALVLPRLPPLANPPTSNARNDLLGFLSVALAMVVGYMLTAGLGEHLAGTLLCSGDTPCPHPAWSLLANGLVQPLAHSALHPWLSSTTLSPTLQTRWIDLLTLLIGMALTFPLAVWAARRARFETLLGGLRNYFSQAGAAAFLAFIVLYKLGDAFAGSLMTPFLLQAMAFGSAEFGVANKLIGLWITIGGALLGGALMFRLGLWRALMAFGVLQMLSNLGFWWLAVSGKGMLPSLLIPAFDWGLVRLAHATPIDGGLMLVIACENLSSGMGTAAFVAFLMGLCNQRFTATQYALLSAFAAIGRVWVGPLAGVLAETIGWPSFFIVSTALAVPALLLLWFLRRAVQALK